MIETKIRIREEAERDHVAVRRINEAAFGRVAEADLVDALRHAAPSYLSLVADVEDVLVGHILFTPVEVEGTARSSSGESPLVAVGLAPMGVMPEYQGRGIGSALVREGIQSCRRAGYGAAFVLGHPDYYPRFGFVPAHAHGFDSEYEVPQEAFMVLPLKARALAGREGLVRYHPAFGIV